MADYPKGSFLSHFLVNSYQSHVYLHKIVLCQVSISSSTPCDYEGIVNKNEVPFNKKTTSFGAVAKVINAKYCKQ